MQFAPLNIRVIACGGKNILFHKLFLKRTYLYATNTHLCCHLITLEILKALTIGITRNY